MSIPLEKSPRSWTRRKQARPGEILEAALIVFAEKGFAAARMEDIAMRAGVTKGTIYLYFPSKEEVFKSLARQHVGATLSDAMEQAKGYQGSVRDFLAMVLAVMAEKIERAHLAVLPKIIIGESGNFPELARFWREEVIDKALTMMSGLITRGIERGEIRDLPAGVPTDYVARLCVAPILMSIIWRSVFASIDTTPFDYRKFLALHLDVLMRGLAPEGKCP
jgi:AcrR family transcriptional regulator